MTFSEKLIILRKKKGMSQEQLAEILNVSRQSVSKWEAQQSAPETAKVVMLADVFGVSIDSLLRDDQTIDVEEPIVIKGDSGKQADYFCCPSCGRSNPIGSRFCGYCNHSFATCVSSDDSHTAEIKDKRKMRTSMNVWMIICFVFALIYAFISIAEISVLSAALFFFVLGMMFLLLSFSPKSEKYMFGKKKGLRKGAFVAIFIVAAFLLFGLFTVFFPIPEDFLTTFSEKGFSIVFDKISGKS